MNKLRIFISSTMQDLQNERKAVAEKLGNYIHENVTRLSKETASESEIEEVIKKILFSF